MANSNLGRPSKNLGKPFQCALYANEDDLLKKELEKGVPKAETVRKWCKERFLFMKEIKELKNKITS